MALESMKPEHYPQVVMSACRSEAQAIDSIATKLSFALGGNCSAVKLLFESAERIRLCASLMDDFMKNAEVIRRDPEPAQ